MTDTFTPTELAAIRVDLAECEREAAINAAAKKVADAAVATRTARFASLKVWRMDGAETEAQQILDLAEYDAGHAFAAAVREYRALTESPPLSPEKHAVIRKACDGEGDL